MSTIDYWYFQQPTIFLLSPEVFVVVDVLSHSKKLETRVRAATARRERLTEDTSHLVLLNVVFVMKNFVNTRVRNLVAGFENISYFSHRIAPL
ncbi:hypothetical protein DPM35_27105 [Mesorhizobium atlanticum]|uniref:Uncharacterized protein n=1 Tax=Mesorhizobium atlanticum TaxID=2233532 RepID=A0A330GJT9_9HYPH|nr:hypothetical protein DPM35_27105 [Mesorhizobium atlanticum]